MWIILRKSRMLSLFVNKCQLFSKSVSYQAFLKHPSFRVQIDASFDSVNIVNQITKWSFSQCYSTFSDKIPVFLEVQSNANSQRCMNLINYQSDNQLDKAFLFKMPILHDSSSYIALCQHGNLPKMVAECLRQHK